MRERPLSASSIKTYLQCLLKYYYRYEDKKPRGGKTEPLAFGIAMHEALEYLHQRVADTGRAPTAAMYDEVLGVFMSSATENGLSDMKIYQEGKDMLLSRLDAVDPDEKVVGLELRFELKTPKGTPYLGAIDKLVELDKDTVAVIDYKTSRVALTQDEADTDIQMSMYDLAVSEMFPQYTTIICALDYLRLSEVVTHRTPEQRKLFVDFLDAVYANIRNTESEDVKPNLNEFCPWCDAKSYCPEYQRVLQDPDLLVPPVGELSNEDFVVFWGTLGASKKIIDGHQRQLKAEAFERMKTSDAIRGGEKELYRVQSSRVNYDPKTVYEVAGPEAYVRMSSVGKTVVDRFLRDNPEYDEKVKETASFSFMSPSFRLRKAKK
jgi:putative RecB family exonuclease